MGIEDSKAQISIGAKIDEAVQALAELQGKFASFATHATEHMNSVGKAGDMLVDKLKEIGSAFLTFEGIKKGVEVTKDLGVEALKLASIFGITQAEASQFAVALDDVHSNAAEAEHAAAFLARQLRGNEEVLHRAGLATRDANGHLKDQKTLFLDAIAVANSYKAGTDRNTVAVQLFGRGALELQDMLRLTKEGMAESAKTADALGLTLTDQGARAVMDFRDAMSALGTVTSALWNQIGQAFMPILTNLAKWFSRDGPDAVRGFGTVIKTLAQVFDGVNIVVQLGLDLLVAWVRSIVVFVAAVHDSIAALASGDAAEAKAVWKDAFATMGEEHKNALAKMDSDALAFAKRQEERWNPSTKPAGEPGPSGTKTFTPRNVNALAEAETALARIKMYFEFAGAAQGNFQKFSLEQEAAYWEAVAKKADLSIAERQKVWAKYYGLETQILERAQTAVVADLKNREAAYKNDLDTKLALAEQAAKETAKLDPSGPNGPLAIAAKKETESIKREIEQRARDMAETTGKAADDVAKKQIDSRRSSLDAQFSLFQISKLQQLTAEKALLAQEQAIDDDAIDRQVSAEKAARDAGRDYDLKKINELEAQKRTLDADYESKRLDLDRQTTLEMAKYAIQARQGIQSAFATAFQGILPPWQKTVAQMAATLGDALLHAVWNAFSAKVAEQLFGPGGVFSGPLNSLLSSMGLGDLMKEGSQITATTALTTAMATNTAAIATLDVSIAGLTAALVANAATQGGGDIIQLAMAAATFAAPGGFDVPAGLSPVTKLHPKEMVLPEHLAERVRGMTDDGGGDGGTHVHFHGDVYGMSDFQDAVAKAVRGAARSGNTNLAMAGRRV